MGDRSEEVKQKIYNDLNERSDMKHNSGRPKRPPNEPETAALGNPATFLTSCRKEHQESLTCIEQNYTNRPACEPFFQAYKECRKEENERRKAANAAKGRGWFW